MTTKTKSIDFTQEQVKEIWSYNPIDGVFKWELPLKGSHLVAGDVAGSVDKVTGYCKIKYDGRKYKAHRLAWLYVYGEIPVDKVIDHIDGNPSNNRISNLRLCFQAENMRNRKLGRDNTSGYKGVSPCGTKWKAQASFQGKVFHIGLYTTKEQASFAYKEFCKQRHGEFYRDTATEKLKQDAIHSPINPPNPTGEKQGD